MKASTQGVRRRKTAAVKGVSVQASSGTFAIPTISAFSMKR
jgi:hypothetical protein